MNDNLLNKIFLDIFGVDYKNTPSIIEVKEFIADRLPHTNMKLCSVKGPNKSIYSIYISIDSSKTLYRVYSILYKGKGGNKVNTLNRDFTSVEGLVKDIKDLLPLTLLSYVKGSIPVKKPQGVLGKIVAKGTSKSGDAKKSSKNISVEEKGTEEE